MTDLQDSLAIDGSPAQAFASHKTRESAFARQYAIDNPLKTMAIKASEDNTLPLIAHLQAVSDDPRFSP